MVRPRESYDQHLIEATLTIDPAPCALRWLQDVFGNSVAIASFDRRATRLDIDSRIRLEHNPAAVQDVDIEDYARFYPFTYASEEMPDLLINPYRPGRHEPRVIKDLQDTYRKMTTPRPELRKALKHANLAA